MTSTTVIQPAAIKRAAIIFEQIAAFAHALDRECYAAFGEPVADRDPEEVDANLDRLRAAICHIGWLADRGGKDIGSYEVRGGAEQWLLPPVFHEAQEVTK